MISNCTKPIGRCGSKNRIVSRGSTWFSTFLIIILPKCPFCVMAYSGAMTLCSGKMIYPNADRGSVYFIIGLCALVVLGIALNYRGTRTLVSLFITAIGIGSLLLSQMYWYSEVAYYISVLIIMTAVWNNGSLHHVLSKIYKNYIINYSKT